jgi:hypothetical protein
MENMTKSTSILKLLPAVAAAAFLTVTAVDAQQSGGQGGQGAGQGTQGAAPEPMPGPTMTDEQRRAMKKSFGTVEPIEAGFDVAVGVAVPETVMLRPVPEAIITATPAVRGHHYFALPDGRIALVEPGQRRVVMILD